MRKEYFAVPFSQKRFLESELNLRLSLALISEELGIPFVYTPIGSTLGLGQSEYALHTLDQKWEEYFSLVTSEFRHVNTLETDEVVFWNQGHGEKEILLWVDPMYRDSFRISYKLMEEIRASCRFFSFFMKCNEIRTRSIQRFITKSHRVYMESFATEKRDPFQNNILRVSILVENQREKAEFFLDNLEKVLDFFEACARVTGSDLEVHLLSGMSLDEEFPDDMKEKKARKLAVVCSRSYVTLHANVSFEQIVNTMVSADITFTTETQRCQYLYGTFLTLLSNPRQIRIEMFSGLNQLSLNNCFLMWRGNNLIFEEKKMKNMLMAAKGKISDQKWESEFPSSHPKVSRRLRKEQINVMSSVIDGLGSYFVKVFVMQVISDYYGLSYIHSLPPYFDHFTFEGNYFEEIGDFFGLGEEYPTLEEIFGGSVADIHFFRLLPPLSRLRTLKLAPDELIVSKIARFSHWAIPEHYLKRRISQVGDRFRCKHKDYKDSFQSDVLNIALHIRTFNTHFLLKNYNTYSKYLDNPLEYDINHYVNVIGSICNSMQKLQVPFRLHVYSNATLNKVNLLEEFEHVQLHLKQNDRRNDSFPLIEMSRADLLFVTSSSMSITAGLLAKPDQIQIVPSLNYGIGETIGLLLTKPRSTVLDNYALLKYPQYFERLLEL